MGPLGFQLPSSPAPVCSNPWDQLVADALPEWPNSENATGDVKQPTLGIDYCRIKDPEVMVGSFHHISFRDSYTNPKGGGEVRTTHPNDHHSMCW